MKNALKSKIIEILRQDRKREYLDLCKQDYAQAVSIIQELYPELYRLKDPFDALRDKAIL